MKKVMMPLLGMVLGFIQGIVLFAMFNESVVGLFNGVVVAEWGYIPLVFGGVGAVIGAVLGWAVSGTTEHRVYVSVPRRTPRVNDLSYPNRITTPNDPVG